ncbi:segregation/condensation protein A [Candidatus Micrarchaeota archaeon]|nr:segregation/condensation protein A [Candidatus Micrarchaeota archaeon]
MGQWRAASRNAATAHATAQATANTTAKAAAKNAAKNSLPQSTLAAEEEEEDFDAPQEQPRPSASFENDARDMNIEKMILVPTWKEMLYEMVHSQKIDPWNIDISKLTSGYIGKIQKLKLEDLRIPANIILAASILLRFKSDSFSVAEESPQATLDEYMEESQEGLPLTIESLELKSRIPPRRRVTLEELVGAMEEAMQAEKKRETKASEIKVPQIMNIELPGFDIEEKMAEVYESVRAGSKSDAEGFVLFSSLVAGKSSEQVIYTFLPLLHLVQDERISMHQEDFFKEIFISLKDANGKALEGNANARSPKEKPNGKGAHAQRKTGMETEGAIAVEGS